MALPPGWHDQTKNFLGISEPWCDPAQAGVHVIPAPYEHTSSYIQGSKEGPDAIIEASRQVELYDESLGYEPYQEWGGIATATPVDLKGKVDREAVDSIERAVETHVQADKFVVTLTGEHTGALGAIRAHARRYPNMCVVQVDAHGDLRNAYEGNPYSHASVMARVVDEKLPLVQVGIRSISPEEMEMINRGERITTFFCVQHSGSFRTVSRPRDQLGAGSRAGVYRSGLPDARLRWAGCHTHSGVGHAGAWRARLV